MMTPTFARGLAAAAFLACAAQASAHDYHLGDLAIGHPWARPSLGQAPNSVGYMTLRNDGKEPDRLLDAETPAAAKVELHESRIVDGTAQMRPLPGGLVLPPGETVTLQPGGYHLMIMGVKQPFVAGERVPMTLLFERAGEVTVEFAVQPLTASEPAHDMDHGPKPAN